MRERTDGRASAIARPPLGRARPHDALFVVRARRKAVSSFLPVRRSQKIERGARARARDARGTERAMIFPRREAVALRVIAKAGHPGRPR